MVVYIDNDYKCHVSPNENLTAVETDTFEGKCRRYIEGYRFVPAGETWTRKDGQVFAGEMASPWRDNAVLEELQALYEEEKEKQADMAAALYVIYSGVTE